MSAGNRVRTWIVRRNRRSTIRGSIPKSPAATVERLFGGTHHNPHSVLGAHPHPDGTVVRVLRPHADEVRVVREGGQSGEDGESQPLTRVHDAGLFCGVVPGPAAEYRLAVRHRSASTSSMTRTAGCRRSARSTCT